MDIRRALSIIAQGTHVHRASRISNTMFTSNDIRDLDIERFNDLTITNIERRRSSRVSLFLLKIKIP
jgi:hypothetical protein